MSLCSSYFKDKQGLLRRCLNQSSYQVFTPENIASFGGGLCKSCAIRFIVEYRKKLNEPWKLRKMRPCYRLRKHYLED